MHNMRKMDWDFPEDGATDEYLLDVIRQDEERHQSKHGVQQTILWFAVILVVTAVVYVASGR